MAEDEGINGSRGPLSILKQPTRLGVAQRQGRAFIAVGHVALDAVDRIAGDGGVLAEIVEQGGERREFAADAGGASSRFSRSLHQAMTWARVMERSQQCR